MSDLFEAFEIKKSARISDCGQYRYHLGRVWDDTKRSMTFVMLNPSTADANQDDPTIRRCIGFARRDGYGGISIVNLYAFRATDPEQLKHTNDPFGTGNLNAQREAIETAHGGPVVCAWGTKGTLHGGYRHFIDLAQRYRANLVALGITKDGHPKHPLYLKGDAAFVRYPSGEPA